MRADKQFSVGSLIEKTKQQQKLNVVKFLNGNNCEIRTAAKLSCLIADNT